ncbi:MAG: molybdopterin molybdotransferase MoeA [Chloroflexi bacterium]|nr:molybdopterin molybdotransferase MoeA [Chloroflexota bacterium]
MSREGAGRDGGMLGLEDALARILDGWSALAAEEVDLAEGLGQVLAAPVVASTSLPPWDNSAMDGYAVRSGDVAQASPAAPVRLRVIGEVAAGHVPPCAVESGTAVRITTGAMVPDGADAVVPVEDTDTRPGVAELPDAVGVRAPAPAGANVRFVGEDVRSGQRVLDAGRVLGPASIALAAAAGAARASVHRRPRVGILSTGDELVPAGTHLPPARIHDSNTPALLAQARASGAIAASFGIAADEPASLRDRLTAAIAASDVVVLSGGVSVGAHDHVKDALASLGSVDFWRVAVQPGKPLAFGRTVAGRAGDVADPDRRVALFGLPGNPVSAFVTFELFVRPLLRLLLGEGGGGGVPGARRRIRGTLVEAVSKAPGRRAFLRVRVEAGGAGAGRALVRPAGGQGSHVLSALAAADGLAIVPEELPGLPAGAEVDVLMLEGEGA